MSSRGRRQPAPEETTGAVVMMTVVTLCVCVCVCACVRARARAQVVDVPPHGVNRLPSQQQQAMRVPPGTQDVIPRSQAARPCQTARAMSTSQPTPTSPTNHQLAVHAANVLAHGIGQRPAASACHALVISELHTQRKLNRMQQPNHCTAMQSHKHYVQSGLTEGSAC
jgi:hypothetical protein